jgi:hypothetical protein
MAFARNLSSITEIRGTKEIHAARKPKQLQEQPLAVDRGLRISTRELKMYIATLEAWLASPSASQEVKKYRGGMQERLDLYRKELAQRDERDNPPLSGEALAKKFAQAAPRARARGMHVH